MLLTNSLPWQVKRTPALALWLGLLCHSVIAYTHSYPFPGEDACPVLCETAGPKSENWTTYSSVARLDACEKTVLLDLAVYTPLGDVSKHTPIKACTPAVSASVVSEKDKKRNGITGRQTSGTNQTGASIASVQVAWWESGQPGYATTLVEELTQIRDSLKANADIFLLFASRGNASVGVFTGALVKDAVLNSTVFSDFATRITANGVSQGLLAQVCGPEFPADYTFGAIVATGKSRLELIQSAAARWLNGSCVVDADGTGSLGDTTVAVPTKVSERSKSGVWNPTRVQPRATCETIRVESGDGCSALASKCGISLGQFEQYNPGSGFCSSLQPGQMVCCSSGTLPTPTPNADGTCASYMVQSGDWCAKIAAANGVTVQNLEDWNNNTWGWTDCTGLKPDMYMCLSDGSAPMPNPQSGYICGPEVPDTPPLSGATLDDLAKLNPCPLNACCDIWGRCGTTTEFCTSSGTKPGTAAPGTNGCISNCGTDIKQSGPPDVVRNVAYFEGWNPSRACLNMDVQRIESSKYNYIHFGFAGLTRDSYEVNISSDTQSQFDRFVAFETPMKRILSFGGWSFSTSPPDYDILRNAMTPANRDLVATNIANFITDNNLDGVDIDWEYPGAPDIPNIPPGSPDDGTNYLKFLTSLKAKLSGKSLSIAAPASYWYLKGFPIKQIATVVDYIVYMTYDLHGQWDYDNKYSQPGCANGNCLRSHINLTETLNALSMVTKAGVPSNKLLIGVSSYGRSFGMVDGSCTGPMCQYTGPDSGATGGPCTNTPGYIANAELRGLVANAAPDTQSYYDADSDSDIVVFGGNQWVAYMNDSRKQSRKELYQSMNFGGSSDWAVDLAYSYAPSEALPDVTTNSGINIYTKDCTDNETKQILEAWVDGALLSELHYQWVPKKKWQVPMDLYMGNKSRDDSDFFGDPGPIQINILYEYKIHHLTWSDWPLWSNTYGFFYCKQDNIPGQGGKKSICIDPDVNAQTWSSVGTWRTDHYVLLCPRFFTKLKSLAEVTDQVNGNIPAQLRMENWKPVRARVLLHETYHWDSSVAYTPTEDMAYSPQEVADLAYYKNSGTAQHNTESYAIAAMAIYAMDTFNHDNTPTPGGGTYIPGNPPAASDAGVEIHLASPPDDFVPPIDPNLATVTIPADMGAVALSDFGSLTDDRTRDCLEGVSFDTEDQCEAFCPFAQCVQKNETDGEYYQCQGCPMPGGCVNGNYRSIYFCQKSCTGGTCTGTPGSQGVDCSGCGPNVCTNGRYADFDECGDNCFEGLCQENAGEEGVVCTCP